MNARPALPSPAPELDIASFFKSKLMAKVSDHRAEGDEVHIACMTQNEPFQICGHEEKLDLTKLPQDMVLHPNRHRFRCSKCGGKSIKLTIIPVGAVGFARTTGHDWR